MKLGQLCSGPSRQAVQQLQGLDGTMRGWEGVRVLYEGDEKYYITTLAEDVVRTWVFRRS